MWHKLAFGSSDSEATIGVWVLGVVLVLGVGVGVGILLLDFVVPIQC